MLAVLRFILLSVQVVLASIIGLIIGVCRPFSPDNSPLFARLYSVPAAWILGIRVKAEMSVLDNLPPGSVIIGNHQSNFDLFIVGQVIPRRTVAVGKKSLGWIPLFGQLFWLGGNVLIDRGNAYKARRAMLATTKTLQQGTSIWIFPEGTRNQDEQLRAFKKGAFHMALAAGAPIVPVCVSRYRRRMGLNSWAQRTVTIRALAPIATAGLTTQDLPALVEQCREQMQRCIDQMDTEAAPGK